MSKQEMKDVGVPEHMLTEAETKGVDLAVLWKAFQEVQAVIGDHNRTSWQKAVAILGIVITLLPTQAADGGPVKA